MLRLSPFNTNKTGSLFLCFLCEHHRLREFLEYIFSNLKEVKLHSSSSCDSSYPLHCVTPSLLHLLPTTPSCFVLYKGGSQHVPEAVTFHPSASAGFTDVCQHAQLCNAVLNKI